MATGAFIAHQLPYPGLYVPLILASHYLEDWIPHWDVGTGLHNGQRKKKTAFWLEWLDLAAAIGFIYFVWQAGQAEIQIHVWLGALIVLLPDFAEAPKNFLDWDLPFLKPHNRFHQWFHRSIPNFWWGMLPQVVVLGVVILIG